MSLQRSQRWHHQIPDHKREPGSVADIRGNPDREHINTSYVERVNLTMRMHMRRFTQPTNAFSKKFENHCHMVALYAVWYNFIRIHKTLRCTPAMESSVTDRLFSFDDLIGIVDEWEANQEEAS